jgi:hypothetical protein
MSRPSPKVDWPAEAKTQLREIVDSLDLCGCGKGTHWGVILTILQRAEDEFQSFYDGCEDASSRWMEFGAKVLDMAGLLEHDTGIGWAGLTSDGAHLLTFLEHFGVDEDGWPEWASEKEMRGKE